MNREQLQSNIDKINCFEEFVKHEKLIIKLNKKLEILKYVIRGCYSLSKSNKFVEIK
jgi:hypothetical protein